MVMHSGIVVTVSCDGRLVRTVTSQEHTPTIHTQPQIVERKDTKKYVENSIRDILMKGGPCTLRIKRRRGALVCERCGSDQMVEIRQAGDTHMQS